MSPRHKWGKTESQENGEPVERCLRCQTERIRDVATKRLYAFRGGRATHRNKPLGEKWNFFVSGVTPKCVEVES